MGDDRSPPRAFPSPFRRLPAAPSLSPEGERASWIKHPQYACPSDTYTATDGSPDCGFRGVPTSMRMGPKVE